MTRPTGEPSDLSRETYVAAAAVNLRTPLARVGLAASQLERSAATPAHRELAGNISEAVLELDRGIEQLLQLVVPPRAGVEAEEDVSEVLASVRERFAPVLAARGLRWRAPGSPPEVLPGTPDRARRVAVAMLRAATELTREGGSFALDVARDDEGIRFELVCDAEEQASDAMSGRWSTLRRVHDASTLVVAEGGHFAISPSDDALRATARLPGWGGACSES